MFISNAVVTSVLSAAAMLIKLLISIISGNFSHFEENTVKYLAPSSPHQMMLEWIVFEISFKCSLLVNYMPQKIIYLLGK